MIQEDLLVLENKQISSIFFKLTIQSNAISNNAKPGQFVNIRVSNELSPLLRRPISIHKINKKEKSFELLYELKGEGTKILSTKKPGDKINILGPLGNHFTVHKSSKVPILVGGGVGIAPLYALAEEMMKQFKTIYVLIGASSIEKIVCDEEFKKLGAKVIVSTDDGSFGAHGLVSLSLEDLIGNLEEFNLKAGPIFACGSHPMLKAISEIAEENNIDCQLSMEAYMACAIGACKGCAVDTTNGYKMVCKDGPVFNSKEIVWH